MQDLWVVIHIQDGCQSKWPTKQNGCQNGTMTCERQIQNVSWKRLHSDINYNLQISKHKLCSIKL